MKKLEEFIKFIKELIDKLKNIREIENFLDWFKLKLKIEFGKNYPNLKYHKGDIYFVELGKNIGSELNKLRPCIVYSKKKFNTKKGVIIIPFKSLKGKNIIEKYQIKVLHSKENGLKKDSLVDIFYIKSISTKRLNKKIGKLEKKYMKEIDKKVGKMFGLKICE